MNPQSFLIMTNTILRENQVIRQLKPKKGGYFFLSVSSEVVRKLPSGRSTRLICTLPNETRFQCGLNHLGDGNFFVIISKKNLDLSDAIPGEEIEFELAIDPNPLGVEVPEILKVLLEQDEVLKSLYDELSDGKKRNIIFGINRIKNVDLQIERACKLIKEAHIPRRRKV